MPRTCETCQGSNVTCDFKGMFCTPSCNIFHTLLSTAFKSCDFGDHSWGRINSGVSLSNNAIVARARWAFQVSQGSVGTLFRWGEKRLHHVAANLFRKLYSKFHHNCPSFVGDITENILVSFCWTRCIWFRWYSQILLRKERKVPIPVEAKIRLVQHCAVFRGHISWILV